jgi:uroporphyrinogen-III decarboxylase
MWWCSGSSLPVRAPVIVNFMPSWWAREYGLALGERLFLDPEYRAQTLRDMYRLAHDRFGDVGLGQPDPAPVYCLDDLGNATLPAAFGCPVVFADDQYPANPPDPDAAIQAPRDVAATFPMCEIIRQAEVLNQRHGTGLRPAWTTMGVLNAAVRTRGTALFTDLLADPPAARRLLDMSRDLIVSSLDYFRSAGSVPDMLWNQNCTIPLVGPATYERELLRYDLVLHAQAQRRGMSFAIHHCGHFDPYAALYRKVPRLAWIEIGWGSDLRLALDAFPEAHIQVIIGHERVMHGTPAAVHDTMRELLDTAGRDVGRLSFNVPDLDRGTPDENVRAVVEGLLAG